MLHFISVLVSRENDPDNWIFAQEANSLAVLEGDSTYTSVSQMPKNLFAGGRANNRVRSIRDNFGLGLIDVVSYRGAIHTSNVINELSTTLGKRATKKLFTPENA